MFIDGAFIKNRSSFNKGIPIEKTHKLARRCKNCGKIFNTFKSANTIHCSEVCAGNASLPIGSYRKSSKHNQYLDIKTQDGWKLEHRLVMEKHIGRKLERWEEVHHIDGNKHNNALSNLYLIDKKNHSRSHFNLFMKVQKLEWENKWLEEKIKMYEEKYGAI